MTDLTQVQKKRDPRRDPQPGDLVERGVLRRVLEREPGHVVFDLPGQPAEGQKRIELSTWQRWAKGALIHRDLKPANIMPGPTPGPVALVDRDARALQALERLMDGERVVRASLGDLLRASGLSMTTWQARAIPSLRGHGLITTWLEPAGHYKVMRYQITEAGVVAARGVVPGSSAVSSRGRAGVSSGSSSNSNAESTKEEKKETPHDTASPAPVSSPGVVLEVAGLVAACASMTARIAELTETVNKLLAKQVPVEAAKADAVRLGPCERCGAMQEVKYGKNGPFAACPNWSKGCKPGRQRQTAEEREALERARNAGPVSMENLPHEAARILRRAGATLERA